MPPKMNSACGANKGSPIACASKIGNHTCLIKLLPDAMLAAAGVPLEVVVRHELGHCNSWPSNHPSPRIYYDDNYPK